MRNNQELIIDHRGHIKMRETSEFDILNSEAVVRGLVKIPSFNLPLSEKTMLVVEGGQMFAVRRVFEFPIQTVWGISGGEGTGDDVFETPTFNPSGCATVSRTFKCPIPTVMITEVPRNVTFPMREDGDGIFVSYLLGMSKSPTPPDSENSAELRRFHRYPLANIYTDGRLCTGSLNDCHNIYDIVETSFESWKSNRWNSDLWNQEKASMCRQLVRFDPVTGDQIMPNVSTRAGIDEIFVTVAPMLPSEVMTYAWEFAYE